MKILKLKGLVISFSCFNSGTPIFHKILDELINFVSSPDRYIFIIQDTCNYSNQFQILENQFAKRYSNQVFLYKNIDEKIYYSLTRDISKVGIKSYEVISFGTTQKHFLHNKYCELNFYLGEESLLTKKIRNVIPMYGQFENGLLNTLNYFSEKGYVDSPLDNKDMVQFIQNSISFYKRKSAPKEVLNKHNKACIDLYNEFPDDIVGVFGTGYPHYLLQDDFDKSKNFESNKGLIDVGVSEDEQTPISIFKYLEIQYEYFINKILTEHKYESNKNNIYNRSSLKSLLGVEILRNEFDKYKYSKMGFPVPNHLEGSNSLKDFYENTDFEIEGDIWPCYYCSTLQFKDLYKNQKIFKDTNKTCLKCKQTSFMLRNIMSCCTDIDVIVVVKSNKEVLANKIKDFIMKSDDYYIYDLDYKRTVLNENDGPIDIFVTEEKDFLLSFQSLLKDDWPKAFFNSIALWSLTLKNHKFNIGEDFPLAFEPRFIKEPRLLQSFFELRKAFATKHNHISVTEKLKNYTQPREQMLGNVEIVNKIHHRLKNWQIIQT